MEKLRKYLISTITVQLEVFRLMLQRDIFPYYKKTTTELTRLYEMFKERFNDTYVEELCMCRGYIGEEQKSLIEEMELGYCDIFDIEELGDMRRELGLVSENDIFLLSNRFIIPVEDIGGNIVSLIGYYPDKKKYITTPSPFFSKECMFFNFRQAYELSWACYDGFVILVEGLFDCLSLRSIGLPAIATMGADVSSIKGELLKLFKKVLAIPDDDVTGRRALNRYSRHGWNVPSNTTMLKFIGGTVDFNGTPLHCKDMDNFVSWYDANDVREILLSYKDSREEVETLSLV